MPIESDTGRIDQTRFDGGVAGNVAAAIARFTHDDIVHLGRIDTGTPNRFGHGTGAELHRIDFVQRTPEGGSDGGPGGRDDNRVIHGQPPPRPPPPASLLL